MKRLSVYFIVVITLFTFLLLFVTKNNITSFFFTKKTEFSNYQVRKVSIGSHKYYLYIADSDIKRSQGLSNTKRLNTNEGMLFVFKTADKYGFWMKDMKYALDFIFLRNYHVIDIINNVTPQSFPKVYKPRFASDQVIELNAGQTSLNKIKIGDFISFD
ncbi:hypothetical protein A3J15_01370 [Candidatus Roizmanbacteria bacterium RIFCSPLOWO2_02_FULL_38_10]|uniref:DUF192 domain-containing protein n=1 Tax=Candidatus Roizmanbacteria bacterium RIFCSPLOWO2_02_FULL_38_10 TaxID=1802074 RepID=A0A1F7JP39_9BACT|nr:MAG: hypothetical protein A3J15_01370 [Candidatus Roizmanbacteria bacterium RIFCSPLOWO2_02_FULL_38_10]